ncbi:hypothetical protein CON60_31420 [Bacillus toyonensis]|nr:hypothetical protein CON60_31420 [Bacillus toyonensis]
MDKTRWLTAHAPVKEGRIIVLVDHLSAVAAHGERVDELLNLFFNRAVMELVFYPVLVGDRTL